jgi:hypothetical protein
LSDGPVDYRGALEAVERILNRGGEAEAVLEAVVEALEVRGASAKISAGGRTPIVGAATASAPGGSASPITFEGATIGSFELAIDDERLAARVATLISPYVRAWTSGSPA